MTRDRGAAGSSLTGVTALWSLSKNINHSLVLVQPRKTRPYITERLLMGRKESNQTNKQTNIRFRRYFEFSDLELSRDSCISCYLFIDVQTGFAGIVEIKSYNYKKLTLAYGGNGTSLVRISPY